MILIQRDAVERDLTDEIFKRFRDAGLKIVATKEIVPTREQAEQHYLATDEQIIGMANKTLRSMEEQGAPKEKIRELFGTEDMKKIGEQLLEWLREFIVGKKLIAAVLEGEDAIQRTRRLVGYTDPSKAERGTIRGDYADDSISKANSEKRKVRNLVHAADSKEAVERETGIWFGTDFK